MLWIESRFPCGWGTSSRVADFVGNTANPSHAHRASRFDGALRASKFFVRRSSMTSMIVADVIGAMAEDVDYFRGRLDRLVGAVEAAWPSPCLNAV